MSHRHLEEIDRAVALARRAVGVGRMERRERLARFLYERWYLGPTSQRAEVPAHPWQAWSPDWPSAPGGPAGGTVRLHLACAPHTSLHALALVTERTRTWDVPWLLTSEAPAQPVPAPDATVLHLPLEAVPDLREPVLRLLDDLRPFLARAVPRLTLRIAQGAALAQDPGDGRSFGEHRCDLLAGSVLDHRDVHHREVVTRAMARFEEAGVDPRRPYVQAPAAWDRGWQAA